MFKSNILSKVWIFASEVLVILCMIGVTTYLVASAVNYYNEEKKTEVFNQTGSINQESIEIVLCPHPHIHAGRLLHAGKYFKYRFHLIMQAKMMEYYVGRFDKEQIQIIQETYTCMIRKRYMGPIFDIEQLYGKVEKSNITVCKSTNVTAEAYEAAMKVASDIYAFYYENWTALMMSIYNSYDENLFSDMTSLFEAMWALKYENKTLSDYVTALSINMSAYINHHKLEHSLKDIAGPKQQIIMTLTHTRAGQCSKHIIKGGNATGFQRSHIIYTFKEACKEKKNTFPEGSICMKKKSMYMLMFISPLNYFTDVKKATTITPFRVPMDADTLVHVSLTKKTHHLDDCRQYRQPSSFVTCVEDCLMQHALSKMYCLVPWLIRITDRFKKSQKMQWCSTLEDIINTTMTVAEYLDNPGVYKCTSLCKKPCHQYIVSHQLMGILRPKERKFPTEAKMTLLISKEMPVLSQTLLSSFMKLITEMMGSLSFMIGISVVALYDWMIGLSLWAMGKLPFIPAMPPLIKNDVYTGKITRTLKRRVSTKRHDDVDDNKDESLEQDDTMTADEENFYLAAYMHPTADSQPGRHSRDSSLHPHVESSHRHRPSLFPDVSTTHIAGGVHHRASVAHHHHRLSAAGQDSVIRHQSSTSSRRSSINQEALAVPGHEKKRHPSLFQSDKVVKPGILQGMSNPFAAKNAQSTLTNKGHAGHSIDIDNSSATSNVGVVTSKPFSERRNMEGGASRASLGAPSTLESIAEVPTEQSAADSTPSTEDNRKADSLGQESQRSSIAPPPIAAPSTVQESQRPSITPPSTVQESQRPSLAPSSTVQESQRPSLAPLQPKLLPQLQRGPQPLMDDAAKPEEKQTQMARQASSIPDTDAFQRLHSDMLALEEASARPSVAPVGAAPSAKVGPAHRRRLPRANVVRPLGKKAAAPVSAIQENADSDDDDSRNVGD